MSRTINCSNHCSGCGSHFSSVSAFDAHRAGQFGVERYCEEPEDLKNRDGTPRLATRTRTGRCSLTGETFEGVTVWTLASAMDEARESRLAGLKK